MAYVPADPLRFEELILDAGRRAAREREEARLVWLRENLTRHNNARWYRLDHRGKPIVRVKAGSAPCPPSS